MPRIKPTKTLDVLGNLDMRPEEAVGDYLMSKTQEKFFGCVRSAEISNKLC